MNDKTEDKKVVQLRRSDLLSIVSGNNPGDYEQDRVQYSPNEEAAKLKELNSKHAAILDRGGSTMILNYDTDPVTGRVVYTYLKPDQFYFKYCNQSMVVAMGNDKTVAVELGKWWVKNLGRREYKGIVYDPEHIEKDQWGTHVKNGKLNLWTGFGVEARQGSWQRLKYHLYVIICKKDRNKFKYLVKWLAWAIQNPGKAAGTAIVIRGQKGTGKSLLGNAMCKIFGQHSSVLTNAEHLTGKFNSHLETSSFVFSDEAYYPDNESDGVLKGIITEPFFTVEAKYQTPRTVKNCVKVLMCTNYERAVSASVDERRYFVCETDDKYSPSGSHRYAGEKYFNRLYAEVNGDGLSAMMHDLVNMDLGDFNPIWHMPRTMELDKQVFMGLKLWDRIMYDFLQAGFFPGTTKLEIGSQPLLEHLRRTFPEAESTKNMVQYSLALERVGAVKKRSSSGMVWKFPSLHEARIAWGKHNGQPKDPWITDESGVEKWTFRTESNEPEF